jgi:hypothetical protein
MHLDPTDEGVHALIERGIDGPVIMLNLLRLRDVADYTDFPELAPPTPISGREAYERYIVHTRPFLEATGGSLTMVAEGGRFFVGPIDERWDIVLLVRQHSVSDFFSFATNAEYLAGAGHRTAAAEDTRLLPLVELPAP